ncbi:hypothetical protein KY363_06095, partial [Candidatus Woesearchaeota archaeon]|nr:hypothetical protein [Candidatus Woesearchaeota archaeon]
MWFHEHAQYRGSEKDDCEHLSPHLLKQAGAFLPGRFCLSDYAERPRIFCFIFALFCLLPGI